MDPQDFTIDTSGDPTATPDAVKRRRALAENLMQQGSQTTPIQSWTQGLARVLQGGIGGYQRGQADQTEAQGQLSARQQLAQALQGGKIDPASLVTAAGNPWVNSAQLGAVSHMADAQRQAARDAVADQHWQSSFGLQQRAANRADDPTPDNFELNPDFGKDPAATKYRPISGTPADPVYIEKIAKAKKAGELTTAETVGAAPDGTLLTGDDYLKTLPPDEAAIVKKLAEYDIDPKSLSVKGGHREDLFKKVSRYDPDYSEPLYGARRQAIKEFTSGGPSSPAGQMTAGNTAIMHAGEMSDALEKMKKGDSGPLSYVGQSGIPFVSYYANALHNKGLKGTPEGDALSEFQTAKNHFSEEVTKFYAGSGGSEAERERALSNIDEAKSLPELRAAIQQEARLIAGKINALQSRAQAGMGPSAWQRAMKESGNFPIVQQSAAASLKKIEERASGKKTVIDGYTITEH